MRPEMSPHFLGSPRRLGSPSRASWYVTLLTVVACGGEAASSGDTAERDGADQTLALEEIERDLSATESKLLALAETLSEEQYVWRPTDEVRSSGQVFMHIASVNYAFPMFTGVDAPPGIAMSMDELFPSIAAYEATAEGKEEILEAIRSSFAHLRSAVEASSTDLDRELEVLGAPTSVRGFWWVHLGHVHEHLGQLVAYARSMGVAPPWS
jgi:uncharacterized damage-inducible protein DinB